MEHKLKIDMPYYNAVAEGRKTFEIRLNDRGYNAGDTIILQAWHSSHNCYNSEKEDLYGTITYVTNYAQKDNWVVFGFKLKHKGLPDVELTDKFFEENPEY